MPKPKKERRFFGLFPGRSNTFAPPARTDDGSAMHAALLTTVITGNDPGPIDDERKQDSASHYDHPASDPVNTPSYQNSPSHYDYGGGSSYDSGSSYGGGGYDSGGSSDGGGGGGGGD